MSAFKITLIYFWIGVLWILLGDIYLDFYISGDDVSLSNFTQWNIIKGLFYVAITSALLFLLLRSTFRKLEKSHQQFENLFFENPSPFYIYENDTLKIVEVNLAFTKMYGYSKEEILNKTVLDICPQKLRLKFPNPDPRDEKDYFNTGPWVHLLKNGMQKYVRENQSALMFNEVECHMVQVLQIHDQIIAEQRSRALGQRLEENENYLRSLIDSQTNYLIRLDTRGQITYINKSFCEKLNLPSEGLPGSLLFGQIFRQESVSHFIHRLSAELQAEKNVQIRTLQIKWPVGSSVTTQWEFVGIFDQDQGLIEIQGIGHDVTDKLELVQLLENERAKLENILASIDNIVWSIDLDSQKILFVNDAFYRILGFSPGDPVFDSHFYSKIIPADWVDDVQHDFLQNLKENEKIEMEIPAIKANGETALFYTQLHYKPGSESGPACINGISVDLTRLKQTEERAKRYAKQLNQIMHSITDEFFSFDHNWCISFANDAFAHHYHKEPQELIGQNIWNLSPELQGSIFEEQYREALTEKKPVYFKGFQKHNQSWVQVVAYPSEEGLSVLARDITEQVIMQEQIQKTQNNIKAVVNSTPNFIWAIDKEYNFVIANKACTEFSALFGVPIVIGKDVQSPPQQIEGFLSKLYSYYQRALTGEYFNVIETISLPWNKTIHASVYFNPVINDAGEVDGVACFSIEITDIIEAEKQILQQEEKLKTIAWLQSHKLRGPLSNIMGLSNLMLNELYTEDELRLMLSLMEQATKELDSVIKEITEETVLSVGAG